MSTHKHIEGICCVILVLVLVLTVALFNAESFGITIQERQLGYETTLFDTSRVHTVDIEMEDWESFLETCENEEYAACNVTIDGERLNNVAIRAKGNTSLSSVAAYGNDRYSFKIEFDQYDNATTYRGLDKLCLNNLIQDNTCMKDYLVYQMMGAFGADALLCSYVYITVNGEEWGLYLAVEGVEESFLQRNYGRDYGELYKPDSTGMGGGRGNGQNFNMDDFEAEMAEKGWDISGNEAGGKEFDESELPESGPGGDTAWPQRGGKGFAAEGMPQDGAAPESFGEDRSAGGKAFGGSMGSSDVALIYSDDAYESYTNIFDNAKTDVTDADKDRLIAALKDLNNGENINETVNVEEVIRYFVVHNFVCNFDSYTGSLLHNYYLYEKDGQLSMIPWDYNLAFGGFQASGDATSLVNYPIDTPVSGGTTDSRPMLAWIFASEEYTELYHQYFAEFLADYRENGALEAMIAETAQLIAPYVEQDPTKFCTYEEFEAGVDALQKFCSLRLESIAGQLKGTIPSTSDGQNADSSMLIDAGDLSVSAMSSEKSAGGRGGMMQRPTQDAAAPKEPDTETDDAAQTMPEPPQGTEQDEMQEPPVQEQEETRAQPPGAGQKTDGAFRDRQTGAPENGMQPENNTAETSRIQEKEA